VRNRVPSHFNWTLLQQWGQQTPHLAGKKLLMYVWHQVEKLSLSLDAGKHEGKPVK
jgi:hypothetical protein